MSTEQFNLRENIEAGKRSAESQAAAWRRDILQPKNREALQAAQKKLEAQSAALR